MSWRESKRKKGTKLQERKLEGKKHHVGLKVLMFKRDVRRDENMRTVIETK